jgi:tRNA threonylcarbamoyladenosine modification (KEOPS) complex Cgi121 subunit
MELISSFTIEIVLILRANEQIFQRRSCKLVDKKGIVSIVPIVIETMNIMVL